MATRIFGAVIEPQSYVNILYLFLVFPLGIVYFMFLVTGLSLGFGLLIIWAGIPILMLVLMGTWPLWLPGQREGLPRNGRRTPGSRSPVSKLPMLKSRGN